MLKRILLLLSIAISIILPTMMSPKVALSKPGRKYSDLKRTFLGEFSSQETIKIRVPKGAQSVLFNAFTKKITEELTITKIIDPRGKVIYNYDLDDDTLKAPLFGDTLFDDGEVTLYMPTQPKFKLLAGIYKIKVYSENKSPIQAEAIIKTGKPNVLQKINLHIWLITKHKPFYKIRAQKRIAKRLRKGINNILSPHQMKVGIIRMSKVNQEMINKYSKIRPNDNDGIDSDLCRQIARLSRGYRQLNILIIDELLLTKSQEKNDESPYIGLSPGMPGMLPTKTSLHSCVLSALDEEYNFKNNDQDLTIWHESLHYMSIPHTSESDGKEFDYFKDTAECDNKTYDEDEDGLVDTDECEDVDVNNIMFWEEGKGNMSKEQAWVIRRHPLFYPARKL